MSDGEPREPLDHAYVEAEAFLDDEAARAARRARVLAAVVETAAEGSSAGPARRTSRWRPGWATAAAIGGLGVLVATFALRSIPPASSPGAPSDVVRSPTALPPVAAEPAPPPPYTAAETRPTPRPAPSAFDAPPLARVAASPPANVPPPPPLPLPPTPAPLRQSEAPPAGALSQDEAAPKASAPARRSVAVPDIKPIEPALMLRSAASAGRTAEVEAALSRGAAVDAADADGDTALILSVRRRHVATAVFLLRRGADPSRLNRAGDSAAALALASGDPRLQEALRAPRP